MIKNKIVALINQDNKQAWTALLKDNPDISKFLSQMPEDINEKQIKTIRNAFEAGFTVEKMNRFVARYKHEDFLGFERAFEVEKLVQNLIEDRCADCFEEIVKGIYNGLSYEQVEFYSKSWFSAGQMREIRLALQLGMDMEKAKEFAKPEFSIEQMKQMYLGLLNGLDASQVSIYANIGIPYDKMKQIRLMLEYGISTDDIWFCLHNPFTVNQIREIRLGFENGLTLAEIRRYANEVSTSEKMREERLKIETEKLKEKSVPEDNEELFNLLDV